MDGNAPNFQDGGVSGKRLEINLAEIFAVERVADIGGELPEIEPGHAARDLLVGVEADPQDAMGNFGMPQQVTNRAHDHGDT